MFPETGQVRCGVDGGGSGLYHSGLPRYPDPMGRVEIVRHPALSGAARITHTAPGIHGNPLNITLDDTEAELIKAMLAGSWHPADPLILESSLRIASSTVFH
jgi:LssY C-terminus